MPRAQVAALQTAIATRTQTTRPPPVDAATRVLYVALRARAMGIASPPKSAYLLRISCSTVAAPFACPAEAAHRLFRSGTYLASALETLVVVGWASELVRGAMLISGPLFMRSVLTDDEKILKSLMGR